QCDSAKTVKCDQNNDIKCDVDFVSLHRKHASLLSFSQNGHFGQLEKLLKENLVDLNFQDQYGWTALMCAAVGGHFDVVLLLLNHGASRYATNSKGETVDDLCPNIDHHVDRLQQQHVITKHVPKFEQFYCEVCSLKFSDTSREEHATSTVHLFNLGLKPKTDNFSIQSNNVGFQLMQKSGWDGESGLGTKGQGQKYPVKTSLKRDRRCLGNGEKEKLKPKVTHFGPNDETAVKSLLTRDKRVISARTISRQERNRKINTDKKWERHLRTYMNLD
ncbi:G patch domain and ankyrin repeat-containing protein 1-like, partial [Dreissena polymorpha]